MRFVKYYYLKIRDFLLYYLIVRWFVLGFVNIVWNNSLDIEEVLLNNIYVIVDKIIIGIKIKLLRIVFYDK